MNSTPGNKKSLSFRSRKRINGIFTIVAVITIGLAAVLGSGKESGELEQEVESMVPDGYQLKRIGENTLILLSEEDETDTLGYLSACETDGYSGPLKVAVMVDRNGSIMDITVLSHRETPSYFQKVMKQGFTGKLEGKSYADPFVDGEDFDAVTGATFTSAGIASGVREAGRQIAASYLDLPAVETPPLKVKFGIPEITLILLYLMVLVGVITGNRLKKAIRWGTLTIGFIILGCWFSIPLSLGKVNVFLLGYWPHWQTSLYWYMLLFSVFGLILINRKKWYCNWFCPFLAAQEYLALIGGGKIRLPANVQFGLAMFQRILAWLAVMLALYFRSPVKYNYELFGTLFNFTGSLFFFVLLGLFLIASLFIRLPYCHILCPVNAINDLFLYLRDRRARLQE